MHLMLKNKKSASTSSTATHQPGCCLLACLSCSLCNAEQTQSNLRHSTCNSQSHIIKSTRANNRCHPPKYLCIACSLLACHALPNVEPDISCRSAMQQLQSKPQSCTTQNQSQQGFRTSLLAVPCHEVHALHIITQEQNQPLSA